MPLHSPKSSLILSSSSLITTLRGCCAVRMRAFGPYSLMKLSMNWHFSMFSLWRVAVSSLFLRIPVTLSFFRFEDSSCYLKLISDLGIVMSWDVCRLTILSRLFIATWLLARFIRLEKPLLFTWVDWRKRAWCDGCLGLNRSWLALSWAELSLVISFVLD